MSSLGQGRSLLSTPFLLDTREFVTDKCTLRQLTHFAHAHRLGSPLWLSWDLAAGLGLTLRYMQSPLSIWSPLMGESFLPLTKSSRFADAITRQYPVKQTLNFSNRPSTAALAKQQILVLSAAASPDGNPRWYGAPESIRHLFVLPAKSSPSNCHTLRQGNEFPLLGLWISAVLLSRMTVAPESTLLVHTPPSCMCVVNADQLYPSSFLAEKELECILRRSSGT
ncbi:uncharacterized protein Tco025E_04400 [Trypanosoma conorhini]|uniref:Uncharacterized protein n=1 Tax=Trypanosoma conorhini TaxID=83891 RepID=A0A3R7N9H8_9TRYP|nr:uncharacterized protein Tco025E_04400 [Trypanosoma conorhini]RNF18626.1 hypothetical protein Tco025E_04400 [Trypanosoma conorhini]